MPPPQINQKSLKKIRHIQLMKSIQQIIQTPLLTHLVQLELLIVFPPTLLNITANKTSLTPPDSLEITVSATDNLSGVKDIGICYSNDPDMYYIGRPDSEGVAVFKKDFNEYVKPEIIKVFGILLVDKSGNEQYYVKNPTQDQLNDGYKPLTQDIAISVKNDDTSTGNNPPIISGNEVENIVSGGIGGSLGYSGGSSSKSHDNVEVVSSSNIIKVDTVSRSTTSAVKKAISSAKKSGLTTATATINITSGTEMTPQTLNAIVKAIKEASTNKGVTVKTLVSIDKKVSNSTISSIVFDPTKSTLKSNIKFGVSLDDKITKATLSKQYTNQMIVMKLEQKGKFGMPVEVIGKVNLGKLDKERLRFYLYDKKNNSITLIEEPDYFIDKKGDLHFTTRIGGNVIITDGVLKKT